MNNSKEKVVKIIRQQFPKKDFIALHEPLFIGNEKKYVLDAIDSTYVSSVGKYVNRFEEMIANIVGTKYAVATVNGTSALHMSLILGGVVENDEVLTQSLTFIATCNAIKYCRANPVFIDVDKDTLGMSPEALESFLNQNAILKEDGFTYNKISGNRITACVPMHTFGLPCRVDQIEHICIKWNIVLIEDAAESLGSYYKDRHTGSFGKIAAFSFNGNKTVTCGGGGAIVTDDRVIAERAKHLTTQAKVMHPWAFFHDEIGYNYRMPNINAALACAQLEQLDKFVENKRELFDLYKVAFSSMGISMLREIFEAKANYWLNGIILNNQSEQQEFLIYLNDNGVMARPPWELMHRLQMFENCLRGDLSNSEWIVERLINIPSGVRLNKN